MHGTDMKIQNLLKNLKRKIENLDVKVKAMYKENCSTNPFAFNKQRTYVWIEKTNKDNCSN